MAIEYFPRRPVSRPSTRIQTDTSQLTGTAIDSDKKIMLLGSAEGGKPNTIYKVRNYIQAKEVFRGGELLDALEMIWNPSNTSQGGGIVLAMRVEDAQNAELEKEGVKFVSRLYGADANEIEVELKTVTVNGNETRSLEVRNEKDGERRIYQNIGGIIDIKKAGKDAPAYASVEVTEDKLIIKTGDSEEEATKLEFRLGEGTFSRANILANEINSIKGLEAQMPTGGNKNINTFGLDPMEETEIENGRVRVTGLLADIHKQLEYDAYLDVEIDSAQIIDRISTADEIIIKGGTELQDFPLESLAGGDTGIIPETWFNKIRNFANEGGYYLVPLTDSPTIHAEAKSFVQERTDNGEPMRVIAGAGYDETPSQLLGRASTLRSSRVALVGASGKRSMNDGRLQELPGYMIASLIAGIASGSPIGDALTFETVNLADLATIYDGDQMDALNTGGVIMIEFVRDYTNTKFRIVDDITTFNDPSKPVDNQIGVGEGSDFLVSELKNVLDDSFIGSKVINISASVIRDKVQSFLDEKVRKKEVQDYDPQEVQVVINGEIANISLVVYPIRSLKRIEVSMVYKQQVLEA